MYDLSDAMDERLKRGLNGDEAEVEPLPGISHCLVWGRNFGDPRDTTNLGLGSMFHR